MFSSLNIAGSGMDVAQTWMDAIGNNIANVNTVVPTSQAAYQTEYVEAAAVGASGAAGVSLAGPDAAGGAVDQGVEVTGIARSSSQGLLQYDPTNPMADASGMVRGNTVDLGEQMTDLIMAQRSYEANVSTIKSAQQAYQAALGLKL